MNALTSAQYKFLEWLSLEHPAVLNEAMRRVPMPAQGAGLSGILDLDTTAWLADFNAGLSTGSASSSASSGGALSTIGSWFSQLAPVIQGVGQAVVTVKAQNDLLKINLERAKQGLEPLTPQQAGTAVGVSVGVDPATAKAAQMAALVPLALIGLGFYFVFNKPKSGGRKGR